MEEATVLASSGTKGAKLKLIRDWILALREYEANPRRSVAVDSSGNELTFVELLLESNCLERFLEGYARNPVEADTEMLAIFRHCLDGDELLHRKILSALNNVSIAFGSDDAPSSVISSLVEAICALKTNAKTRGTAQVAISSQDRSISDKFSYFASIEQSDRWSHKARISLELVELSRKKVGAILDVYGPAKQGSGKSLGVFRVLEDSLAVQAKAAEEVGYDQQIIPTVSYIHEGSATTRN